MLVIPLSGFVLVWTAEAGGTGRLRRRRARAPGAATALPGGGHLSDPGRKLVQAAAKLGPKPLRALDGRYCMGAGAALPRGSPGCPWHDGGSEHSKRRQSPSFQGVPAVTLPCPGHSAMPRRSTPNLRRFRCQGAPASLLRRQAPTHVRKASGQMRSRSDEMANGSKDTKRQM